MSKIQTKISIESSERLTIKRKRYSIRAWCDDCGKTSIMTLPSEAAFLACQDVDSIIYLMYANRLHVRRVERKGLFVCLASLCRQTFDDEIANSESENEFEMIEIDAVANNCDFLLRSNK